MASLLPLVNDVRQETKKTTNDVDTTFQSSNQTIPLRLDDSNAKANDTHQSDDNDSSIPVTTTTRTTTTVPLSNIGGLNNSIIPSSVKEKEDTSEYNKTSLDLVPTNASSAENRIGLSSSIPNSDNTIQARTDSEWLHPPITLKNSPACNQVLHNQSLWSHFGGIMARQWKWQVYFTMKTAEMQTANTTTTPALIPQPNHPLKPPTNDEWQIVEEIWKGALEACHGTPPPPTTTTETMTTLEMQSNKTILLLPDDNASRQFLLLDVQQHLYQLPTGTVITPVQSYFDPLSAKAWLQYAMNCGNSTFWSVYGGDQRTELCLAGWMDRLSKAFGVARRFANIVSQQEQPNSTVALRRRRFRPLMEESLRLSARCALHLEFPMINSQTTTRKRIAQQEESGQATTTVTPTDSMNNTNNHHNPSPPLSLGKRGWGAKRIILLTLAMGSAGFTRSCKIFKTAFPRGWEIVLVTGSHFKGIKHKYEYVLKAISALFPDPAEEETSVVIFVDAFDVIIQQHPQETIKAFEQQEYGILWSAEDFCFPHFSWPHNLGLKRHVCNYLFPTKKAGSNNNPEQQQQQQQNAYVNGGGWIGIASMARKMLQALQDVVTASDDNGDPDIQFCHDRGTDQLLANALFLKYQNNIDSDDKSNHVIGIDASSTFFQSDPRPFLGKELVVFPGKANASNQASFLPNWCFPNANENNSTGTNNEEKMGGAKSCPTILHFNGRGDDDNYTEYTLEGLKPPTTLPCLQKSNLGTITSINMDTTPPTVSKVEPSQWCPKDHSSSYVNECVDEN